MLSPTLSQKRPPLSWSSPCSALVKGVVPSQVCIPASLASLVLHNPDSLCCLNAAVFLLAYVSAHWKPYGPLQGATPLEHSLCNLLRRTPTDCRVLHLGSTPQQGHYRAFLAHPG